MIVTSVSDLGTLGNALWLFCNHSSTANVYFVQLVSTGEGILSFQKCENFVRLWIFICECAILPMYGKSTVNYRARLRTEIILEGVFL